MKCPQYFAMIACSLFLLDASQADASFVYTFSQVGKNVVLTGVGEISTNLLQYSESDAFGNSFIQPNFPVIETGPAAVADLYTSPTISGPETFGNGFFSFADEYSGDFAYFQGPNLAARADPYIGVPRGYMSGSFLSGSGTFLDSTFASLGLSPGTYTYTYSGRVPAFDSVAGTASISVPTRTDTIEILVPDQVSAVPLPASAPMFGAALLALGAVGYGVKRKKAAAAV